MFRLVRIEWVKLIHQTTTWLLGFMLVGLSGLFPVFAITNVLGNNPTSFRQDSYLRLNFMDGSLSILSGFATLGIILMVVMIGTVVGNEYGLDTWKNLLTWQNGRIRFLAVKLTLTWLTIIVALALTTFLSGFFGWIGHNLVAGVATKDGLKENPITSDQFFRSLNSDVWPLLLHLAIATAITTLFTVLGRSTIVGIMVTLVWWTGENLVMRLLPDFLQNVTVLKNMANLRQYLTDGTSSPNIWQSLLVLALYFVIPLAVGLVVFQKRDITA